MSESVRECVCTRVSVSFIVAREGLSRNKTILPGQKSAGKHVTPLTLFNFIQHSPCFFSMLKVSAKYAYDI